MDCASNDKRNIGDGEGESVPTGMKPGRNRLGTVAGAALKFVVIPTLIVLVIYSPRYDEGLLLSLDEGHYLAPADAVLHGKTLYRDVYTFYGPVLVHGLALCMKLFGTTIATYRAAFIWSNIFVLLLSYMLLLSVVKRNVFAFLGGWMIAFINGASYWYARYGGGRLFIPLLLALCFAVYFRDKRRSWLICVAGILSALSIVTSPELIYPALVISAVGLTVSAIASHRLDKARLLRAVSFYSLGFVVTLLPFSIWLAMRGALVPYLKIGFYDVPFLLGKFYPIGHVFEKPPLSLSLHAWRRFLLTRACLVYVVLAAYGCAAFYLAAAWKRKGEFDVRDSSLAVVLAVGIPMFHISFTRLQGIQLFLAAPPALVVLAFLWERLYEWIRTAIEHLRIPPRGNVSRRIVGLSIALAAFAGSLLWMVHYTVRKANAAVILQNYGLMALPPELRCVTLELERAGIAVPEAQAQRVKSTVDYIQTHTEPGEPILALPHEGTLHFLADRPSATRFSSMVLTELRPEYASEAIEDLEKARPRLAVYAADSYLDPFFDVPTEKRIAPILDYLKTHYTEVDAIGDTRFYVRNDQQDQS